MLFVESKGTESATQDVFRPKFLGDLSQNALGPIVNLSYNPYSRDADFQLNYILN